MRNVFVYFLWLGGKAEPISLLYMGSKLGHYLLAQYYFIFTKVA